MMPVAVAAGILRRDGRILACRRRLDDPFGGKWEFPGGKLRDGETPAQALLRELAEELGITASAGPEVGRVRHTYAGRSPLELHFFEVERFHPEPVNHGFEEMRWVRLSDLEALDWLEADRPLVRQIAASDGASLPPRVVE